MPLEQRASGAGVSAASGLRRGVLGPGEILAQSVSTVAPSTTPTLTIPLVAALAGQASCWAYVLALCGILLIALCVAMFARESSSAGSLYSYVRGSMPPVFGVLSALALLFAYVMTAASVLGGFLNYSYVFLGGYGQHVPPALLVLGVAAVAVWLASQDVTLSSELMLWIELVSVLLIVIVLAAVLSRFGWRLDMRQLRLQRGSLPGVRLGVMLALFSFVGFESATTLGEEARKPLVTIPRAVLQSVLLTGAFFLVSTYAEVLGFSGSGRQLGDSVAPLRDLSARFGLPALGPLIDAGVLVSMFACTLACITAGSRLLLQMAQDGMLPSRFTRIHRTHQTPVVGIMLVGGVAAMVAAVLAQRGVSGSDIYGWMGMLAVLGFLTTYALVAVSLPVHLGRKGLLRGGTLVLGVLTTLAMVLFLLGTVLPLPPAPLRYFPYVYGGYLFCGLAGYAVFRRSAATG